MKKRILFAILGLVILIAVLAGIKALQIRAMIEQGKKFVPPPETVTTATARLGILGDRPDGGRLADRRAGGHRGRRAGRQGGGDRLRAGRDGEEGGPADPPGHHLGRGPAPRRRGPGDADAHQPERDAEMLAGQDHLPGRPRRRRRQSPSRRRPRSTTSGPPSPRRRSAPPSAAASASARSTSARSSREGDPIVTLQSLDPIYVDFTLPQQQLARLRPGLPVRVTSDALPGRDDRRAHHGHQPAGRRRHPQHQGAGDGGQPRGKAAARHVRQRGGRPPGPAEGAGHPGHGRALRPLRRLGLRRRGRQGAARGQGRCASSSCGWARSAATSSPSRAG